MAIKTGGGIVNIFFNFPLMFSIHPAFTVFMAIDTTELFIGSLVMAIFTPGHIPLIVFGKNSQRKNRGVSITGKIQAVFTMAGDTDFVFTL